MRMTLNDIGKAMRSVLSAVARAAWGITLCAGGLAVGMGHYPLRRRFGGRHRRGNPIGRVELHVRHPHRPTFNSDNYLDIHLVINPLIHKDMAKRNSKTAAQQCRFYEVDNIFEYMVETYINGNFSSFRRLYHELNKEARKDFIDFLLSEAEPVYWREILKETI